MDWSCNTPPVRGPVPSPNRPLTRGEGMWKKPFPLQFFLTRLATTYQKWEHLYHKLLVLERCVNAFGAARVRGDTSGSVHSAEKCSKLTWFPRVLRGSWKTFGWSIFHTASKLRCSSSVQPSAAFPCQKNQDSRDGGNGKSQDCYSLLFKKKTLSCSRGIRGEVLPEWGVQPKMSSLRQDINCCWEYLQTGFFQEVICGS